MVKACLIGVSGYGATHYNDLMRETQAGRAEVVAATVINQDVEAEKCERLRSLGCEIHDDYRAMLAAHTGKADLCFIPTGIALHAPMTIAALQAGMNVYVEKPAAGTIQEVRAMRQAARAAGRFVAVGYQSMYADETAVMKRAILDGRLGEVRSISFYGLWPRNRGYYGRNGWAGQLKVGDTWVLDSPFNNAMAHQLNMICFLAGASDDASATLRSVQAELYHARPIPGADTASIRIATAEGPTLYCQVSHACSRLEHPLIRVRGTRGEMAWLYHQSLEIRADGRVEKFPVDDPLQMRPRIFDALLRRLTDPTAFVCTLEIAAAQTLAVNGAHESSPVHPVPQEHVHVADSDWRERFEIPGIEDLARRAFDEERLFSELGAPWARPGKLFDLRGYEKFAGGRTGA